MDRVDLLTTGSMSIGIVKYAKGRVDGFVYKSIFDKVPFKTGARDAMNGAGDRIYVTLDTKQNVLTVQRERHHTKSKFLNHEGAFLKDNHRQLALRLMHINSKITLVDFHCVVEEYVEEEDELTDVEN